MILKIRDDQITAPAPILKLGSCGGVLRRFCPGGNVATCNFSPIFYNFRAPGGTPGRPPKTLKKQEIVVKKVESTWSKISQIYG